MIDVTKGKHITVKFVFSKKATKIDKIFTINLTLTTVKISSIFVAFLENMNFNWLIFVTIYNQNAELPGALRRRGF